MEILKFIDSVTCKSFVVKSGSVFSSLSSVLVVGLYQYTPVLMSCLMGEQQGLVFHLVLVCVCVAA